MEKNGAAILQLAGGRSQIEAEFPLHRQRLGAQDNPLSSLILKAEIGKPDIFQYLEYRIYLADFVEWKQSGNAHFSKRAFSQKYFGSTGILYAVIQGDRDLGPKLRVRCAAALALSEKENEYFDLLVQHNQARQDLERNFLFEKLSRFRNSKPWVVAEKQYKYYAKWYYAVVFSYFGLDKKKSTPKEIAAEIFPPLTEKQVQEAIDLLMELELVKKSDRGYLLTRNHLVSGGFSGEVALEYNRQIQGLTIDLAKDDITRFKAFSTHVTTVSNESLKAIRNKFSAFQAEMKDIIAKDKGTDKVCTVVFQIIPNTQ
ncbi:MAG TPA: TIGR02147 family protein [Fibrobacteria bacterium]|nr:TIGR02147 family protein [Fibrobacteria bacterium]